MVTRTLLVVGLAMFCAVHRSSAQSPRDNEIRALRLTPSQVETVHIDGVLSEGFWQQAAVIRDLRQQEPDEGAPATEDTEVRIARDGENLYVGVMAFDSQPDRVVSRILTRDRIMRRDFRGLQFAGDDAVAILFDTFDDNRNAFVFATNPNGAEFEALITDEGREVNVDWRTVWRVAAVRTDQGWSAEFSIPFRSLRYPENSHGVPWGFNITRIIQRKNELVLWQSWSRDNEGFDRVSRAGNLIDMDDLPRSGVNVEVKPFVLGGTRQELDSAGQTPVDGHADVGVDLKSELTPGVVLDLTVNTDFAQVEVDDQRVNLTRFSLFYPEKREFFLENAGLFDLGFRGGFGPPPYQLFFSRQIGIVEDSTIPILGGARLTGRVGGQTVGLLDVVTDASGDVPRTNYSVARMKRDIGENNYLGFMVTDRRDAGSSNTVAAVDGSFWLRPTLNVQGFFTRSFTQGPGGEGNTYSASAEYQTDFLGVELQHLTVEPGARADVGFITRTDIRQSNAQLRLSPRPGRLGIRVVDIRLEGQYFATTGGRMQDWSTSLMFGPSFESGDRVSVDMSLGETQLDEPFLLADSLPISIGRYDVSGIRVFGNTAPQRSLVGRLRGSWQRFFGGTLLSVAPRVSFSPTPQISMDLGYEWNRVEIPAGGLTTNITSVRFGYAFSTRLTTNALLQYNSLDKTVSTNLRLDFIHRPGSDLFVVFTEGRGVDGRLWTLSDRGFTVKLTYLARL